VNIVAAFASISYGVLTEDRVDLEATESLLQNEGIFRSHCVVVLRVALNGEVHDRVLVFVLEETEENERIGRVVFLDNSARDVREVNEDASSSLA